MARKVFDEMFRLFGNRFHNHNEAWDKLIEFLAIDNCPPMITYIGHDFEWFFEDREFSDKLLDVYDLEKIKADKRDHLGDLYVENQSKLSQSYKGQFLTPENVVQMMCKMSIPETDEVINILDPCTGTGRFLMYAHEQAPNARLFGVDIDMRALRVAFTNCAIHNISAMFLNADSLIHDTGIDTPEGIHNWQYANRWESQWDKLKSFSIKPEVKPQKTLFWLDKDVKA